MLLVRPVPVVVLSLLTLAVVYGVVFEKDGGYTFEISSVDTHRKESRDENGVVRGFYNYIDANGMLQHVEYTADENGYRVRATNLPVHVVPVEQKMPGNPKMRTAQNADSSKIGKKSSDNDQV